jgi:hypothetical protein
LGLWPFGLGPWALHDVQAILLCDTLGLVAVKVSPKHATARRRLACAVLSSSSSMSPGLITSAVMAITWRSTRIEGRLRPQPLSASRRPIPFPSPACGSRLRRSTQHGSPPVDTTGPTILSPSRASVDWSQRFRARLLARSEDRHSQSWAPRA